MECPKCRTKMQEAFCARSAGLSCALPEKFDHFIFLDKDLSEAGMKKFIPHSGEWHPSYLCQACKMYIEIVDTLRVQASCSSPIRDKVNNLTLNEVKGLPRFIGMLGEILRFAQNDTVERFFPVRDFHYRIPLGINGLNLISY